MVVYTGIQHILYLGEHDNVDADVGQTSQHESHVDPRGQQTERAQLPLPQRPCSTVTQVERDEQHGTVYCTGDLHIRNSY
jgi:hypothetical protein